MWTKTCHELCILLVSIKLVKKKKEAQIVSTPLYRFADFCDFFNEKPFFSPKIASIFVFKFFKSAVRIQSLYLISYKINNHLIRFSNVNILDFCEILNEIVFSSTEIPSIFDVNQLYIFNPFILDQHKLTTFLNVVIKFSRF